MRASFAHLRCCGEISDEIDKFFRGEEIVLKADIRKGPKLNAVKFNVIEFLITATNKEIQLKLNSFLQNSNAMISMSTVGNSYYRCNDLS